MREFFKKEFRIHFDLGGAEAVDGSGRKSRILFRTRSHLRDGK